ncbi:hypothetical protein ACFHYQ_27985 [Sphaerimonospora cavernae]|uniref:MFS transporter n=1 Tax=Sphaerimonospora cavernae TaxID=1740611 RepID=A0ABV6UD75_9ACTN
MNVTLAPSALLRARFAVYGLFLMSGAAMGAVASLGYAGFLIGPVLIGALAELVGLPRALFAPAVLALFVAFAATSLRPPAPHRDHPETDHTGADQARVTSTPPNIP